MKETSQNEAQKDGRRGQIQSLSTSMPIRQAAQPANPRKSNLDKELEALGTQPLEIPRGLDASGLHITRQKARKLQGISGKLSVSDAKRTVYNFSEPDDIDKSNSSHPKRSRTAIKSEIVGGETDPPNAAAVRSILSQKRAEGLIKWEIWQQRKEKITNILQSRHYNTSSTGEVDLMIEINDDRNDFNWTIQDGLHIFRPTADVLSNFENFLQKVEDIAGRETGVVKVIVPKELLSLPHNSNELVDNRAASDGQKIWDQPVKNLLVVAYLTKLDLRVSEVHDLPIYDVRMMGGLRKSTYMCRKDAQNHRRSVLELHGKDQNHPVDIFNEVKFAEGCGEEAMVECGAHSSSDRYYSADIEASNEKRCALDCGKIHMKEFHSHGLLGARTDKDRIYQPKLQISGAFGSSFGLQMASFGAYSLNVLHSGAPRCWTVIKPVDHRKVEFEFHADAEEVSLRGKRVEFVRLTSVDSYGASKKNQKKTESFPSDFPPRCDQFLNHQPFYIPKGSLQACGIGFTQVVQYEGELIIMFPFAYSQGYSCGPSIAEEVGYTNERSENLGLYHHCHAACTGPKPPIDFGTFPTAAASDARRAEKTIKPIPVDDLINSSAKDLIAKSNMMPHKKVIEHDAQKPLSKRSHNIAVDTPLNVKSAILEDKGWVDEAPNDKQQNQGGTKGIVRRRRLVRAFNLPGYKG